VFQSRRASNSTPPPKKKTKDNEAVVSFSYLGTEVTKQNEVEILKMIMSANKAYFPCYPS
jgi:hypothetical protein